MTEYDDLDWLYDVLYAACDDTVFEQDFLNQFHDILSTPKKVLDASCGNGIQAVALAKKGYEVTAADISEKMVLLTRNRSAKSKVHIETMVSSWQKLPQQKMKYDLVFCYGNSISHSLSKEDRIKNIISLSECLNKEGILIIDTRNWDKISQTKYTIYPKRKYNGNEYMPIYIWDISKEDNQSSVNILFTECKNNELNIYEKKLTFCTFRHNEFVSEINNMGLIIIKDTYKENSDEYCLYIKLHA
ncbi:MAG: class I SAM-dependent methyltransferase [Treponema sp.]|nr:class I SAM-dependent methyltransferase [Treponema sp.]